MTREEFIRRYVTASKLDVSTITPTGWRLDSERAYVALPCHCGEEMCVGWAMVRDTPEDVETHNRFNDRQSDDGRRP